MHLLYILTISYINFEQNFFQLPSKQKNICITFVQCWSNVSAVGPTLYKCYTKRFAFTGTRFQPPSKHEKMGQHWVAAGPPSAMLAQH